MHTSLVQCALVVTLAIGGGVAGATGPAEASAKRFQNCTAMHGKYEHGVGRKGARDQVRGHTGPVTTFKVATAVYRKNRHLDRDRDGVACEQH